MNRINVIGNLTADPVERMAGEHKYASFSIADNTGSGDKREVQYFRVAAWNKLADVVLNYAKKGTKVYVSGPMKFTMREKDGKTYYNNDITRVDDFLLLSSTDGGMKSPGNHQNGHTENRAPAAEPEADDGLPF